MTAPFRKRVVDASRILDAARASLQPQEGYEVGRVYAVPLAEVSLNPANPRIFYPESAAREILSSIQRQGQQIAALGFGNEKGGVTLIDGQRRFKACVELGLASLNVEIREPYTDEKALYLAARTANGNREAQSPIDDALVWKRLLQKKMFSSQVALAKALGLSESEVSRTLSLTELPEAVLTGISEQESLLSLKMLNALRLFFKEHGEAKTLAVIEEVLAKDWGYREVELRAKARPSNTGTPKPRALRQELAFRGGSGTLKSFGKEGRLELSLTGLSARAVEEATRRITELFDKK